MLELSASLWPHPHAAELSRRVVRRGPGETRAFVVLPSIRRPVYLIPHERGAVVALRSGSSGRRGRRVRAIAALQRSRLLRVLPVTRLVVRGASADSVVTVLEQVLGRTGTIAVRLGRPRANRAVVMWMLDPSGTPIAVVKMSTTPAGKRNLEAEYDALSGLRAVTGLRAPVPQAYLQWRGCDLLVLSALLPREPVRGSKFPLAQMRELAASADTRMSPLSDTPLVAGLRDEIRALGRSSDQHWLSAALDGVLSELAAVPVRVGAWHGDWVRWNMAHDGDTVLLWDWEHYQSDALAGFDHIHHLAQELRRSGTDAAHEDAWLVEARTVLMRDWHLTAAAAEAVIQCYLVAVNVRYLRDRDGTELPIAPRLGWGRPLVERITLTTAGAAT